MLSGKRKEWDGTEREKTQEADINKIPGNANQKAKTDRLNAI